MTRRTPAQYDWLKVEFDETILPASPDRTTYPRRQKIQFIVIHHMAMKGVGEAALTACSNAWKTREASAHYGVADGFVRQYVWDHYEAWATANSLGNQAGISIEHANSTAGPTWQASEKTWKTGAKLVAALHLAYKLGRPVWGKTLFQHSHFYNTACAGPYLGNSILPQYVAEAQKQYDLLSKTPAPAEPETKPLPKTVTLGGQILEASGMVLSVVNPGCYWVLEDENKPVRLIRASDGVQVGSFTLKNVTLVDGESLAIDYVHKTLCILDAGNNDGKRKTGYVYTLPEPKGEKNHGALAAVRTTFAIPDKANFECMVINPKSSQKYLVSKAATGALYKLNGTKLAKQKQKLPAYVTDGCYSPTGEHVWFVRKDVDVIEIFTSKFERRKDGILRIPHPDQPQPETIALYPDGITAVVGSEGKNSKLKPVRMPAEVL